MGRNSLIRNFRCWRMRFRNFRIDNRKVGDMADPSQPDYLEASLSETFLRRQQNPEELFALVSQELRQVAGALMRRERLDHTLQATALVNEAYLRLFEGEAFRWENRKHLFCM